MKNKLYKILSEAANLRAIISYFDYNKRFDIGSVLNKKEQEELISRLGDKQRQDAFSDILDRSNPAMSAERLTARLTLLQHRKENRTAKIRRVYIGISSVAAAVLFVSFLIYNRSKKEVNDILLTNTTEQEIVTPTIITSQGDSLVLTTSSSSSNKLIALSHTQNISKDSKQSKENRVVEINQLVVPTSTMYTLELCDGTIVRVNSGSRLLFPSEFSSDIREVELIGEAFFEVTKSDIPFTVKCKDALVKVYGTSFNLSTNEKDTFSALLIEGSVGVSIEELGETKIKPNERLVYNILTGSQEVTAVEPEEYISWINDEFLYKDRPLPIVLNELEAWYNVSFNICTQLNHNITCRFSRKNSVDEILNLLEKVTDVKFIKTERYKYDVE